MLYCLGYCVLVFISSYSGGRRKIRKSTEEKLLEALNEWYFEKKNRMTLRDVYPEWLNTKRTPRSGGNIKRIEASWKAYYLEEPLSEKILDEPLQNLTAKMLREWAEDLLRKDYPVDSKKFSRMFSIINGCFEYASDEDVGILPENTWARARKKIDRGFICSKGTPPDEDEVFTDEEWRQLRKMVYEDLEKYPEQASSAGLEILFILETALRIGECCGLKWTDVRDGRLYIRRQANNEGVREWTKSSSGYRDIPLTEEALRILDDVKKFNEQRGYNGEWIFQSVGDKYDGPLSYNAADRKLRKLCDRMDTSEKSPHKLRKTTISKIIDSGLVNIRTVQHYAGHKDISTTYEYYSYERRSKDEQARAINDALSYNCSDGDQSA